MDLSKDFSTSNGNRTGHEAYNPASYDDDDDDDDDDDYGGDDDDDDGDDDFCPLQQLLRAQNEFWALNYNNEV
jgi:hypothetical protein